jgi:hypothetical protein
MDHIIINTSTGSIGDMFDRDKRLRSATTTIREIRTNILPKRIEIIIINPMTIYNTCSEIDVRLDEWILRCQSQYK